MMNKRATDVAVYEAYRLNDAPCVDHKATNEVSPMCLHGLRKHGGFPIGIGIGIGTEDPRTSSRSVPYAGLKNLGATCFVNTLLQYLFMHLPFRRAILTLPASAASEPSVKEPSVAELLQQLFARLAFGERACEAPHKLISRLGWNNHIQQDVSEFTKKLFDQLEPEPLLKRALKHEFQFCMVTRTCCEAPGCGSVSTVKAAYMELPLHIARHASLEDSLEAYFAEELMHDKRNKFYCQTCRSPQKATRTTCLSATESLPPVLMVQLLRFEFDSKRLLRNKLTHALSIPMQLDLERFRDNDINPIGGGGGESIYRLSAIMRHTGSGVESGHYIADIRDTDRSRPDTWWRFNDSSVCPLTTFADDENSSTLVSRKRKHTASANRESEEQEQEQEQSGVIGDKEDKATAAPAAEKKPLWSERKSKGKPCWYNRVTREITWTKPVETPRILHDPEASIISNDAYMLVYTRTDKEENEQGATTKEELPEHLQRYIAARLKRKTDAEQMTKMAERKQRVEAFFKCSPPASLADTRIMPRALLSAWANGEDPSYKENNMTDIPMMEDSSSSSSSSSSSLLSPGDAEAAFRSLHCEHGNWDQGKARDYCFVSRDAWLLVCRDLGLEPLLALLVGSKGAPGLCVACVEAMHNHTKKPTERKPPETKKKSAQDIYKDLFTSLPLFSSMESPSSSSSFSINMTRGEGGGWLFKCTHDWDDYQGVLSVENLPATSLMRQVLTSKPKILDDAWANHSAQIVGDHIMMTIPFQQLDEQITVKLERTTQNDAERIGRKLISHINHLERQIRELQQQCKEVSTRVLLPLTGEAGISQEQLLAFAREFRDDYKTFKQSQLNTTEADAFAKWRASMGVDQWRLRTDYLARVRNLSMHIPQWIAADANCNPAGAVDGLYGAGCWQVQLIARQSVSPNMQIAGPFSPADLYAGWTHKQFFLSITRLDPISAEDKQRLSLA